MKFSKLIGKVEKIADRHERGKRIKPKKLDELQGLLADKIARYEAKLDGELDTGKREKLEKRLRVVRAQLQKSQKLSAGD